ncbi:flagellar hook-associated family protein [Ancylobacter sp. WKF20]|uniref:flagellar hook-associated family protein n=1 Tax=Ancylobacter sp. WKF20 TaxID=3039801 RepID=UPI00243454DF|nr:flagellar hook-associated family protein [Ancylobacter sp. WKF20]WGD28577.1 flagellar hook-associated family protein [Ancylobacter sp. WKF20]
MRTTFISTLTVMNSPRNALPRLQSELADASKELTTGRRADLGLSLGVGTAESVRLRAEDASVRRYFDGNSAMAAQLERTQATLDDMRTQADKFQQMLSSISDADGAASVLQQQAGGFLDALTSTLNLTDGRRYLFGGINSGQKPINNLDEGPGAAIVTAFNTRFGFDPSDPATGTIPAADLENFIDNEFAAMFEEPGWSATWSDASSTNLRSSISPLERIETSANANEPAMRKLAMAYTMVAALGTEHLRGSALAMVMDKARSLTGTGTSELISISTRLGTSQNRIEAANSLMQRGLDTIGKRIDKLESVDPAEAKTKLDLISTQIEMSYSLTARILKMSIMNYV